MGLGSSKPPGYDAAVVATTDLSSISVTCDTQSSARDRAATLDADPRDAGGVELESRSAAAVAMASTSSAVTGQDAEYELAAAERRLGESIGCVVATFGPGPLGMGLRQDGDVVVVTTVKADSQASAQSVQVGSLILEVAGQSVEGLDKAAVLDRIKEASRPFKILLLNE